MVPLSSNMDFICVYLFYLTMTSERLDLQFVIKQQLILTLTEAKVWKCTSPIEYPVYFHFSSVLVQQSCGYKVAV